jgi:hypothetical protein
MVPTPRTVRAESLLVLPFRKVREGAIWISCSAELILARSMASPLTTLMAIGTFWTFSERFWAVTITSSMTGASEFDWALAEVAESAPSVTAMAAPLNIARRCVCILISHSLPLIPTFSVGVICPSWRRWSS